MMRQGSMMVSRCGHMMMRHNHIFLVELKAMLPLAKVTTLKDAFPKPYCQSRHQLQLVESRTHSALYSIVDYGTVLRHYGLFFLTIRKDFPEFVTIALMPQVPAGTPLPLQEIPQLTQEVNFEEIASITASQKKIKFYFKSKQRSKWRIYPGNQAALNDWADLLKAAIHHQNIFKMPKFTTLKTEWEQFKAKLIEGHPQMYRQSQGFKQEKEQALKETGYSLEAMAKCFVRMKRAKAQVKHEFSTWKSEYKTTIDEHNQIRMISEILSGTDFGHESMQ